MSARVYVEGGGNNNRALAARCREAFSEFFRKAGLAGRMPRVIAGGGRQQTYDDFCVAFGDPKNDAFTVLLIDSEDPIAEDVGAWAHLRNRQDGSWGRPEGATDEHAHLMVQCMETCFLADRETVSAYFGNDFRPNALPGQATDTARIPKQDVITGLHNAARRCRTRGYDKGRDSFKILRRLDPNRVIAASPHANRLVTTLRNRL